MKKRQQRAKINQETLHILDVVHYKNPQGEMFPIASLLALAKERSTHRHFLEGNLFTHAFKQMALIAALGAHCI
jgi:hypothetical protein